MNGILLILGIVLIVLGVGGLAPFWIGLACSMTGGFVVGWTVRRIEKCRD